MYAESSNPALGGVSDSVLPPLDLRRRPRVGERLIHLFLFLCGALSILTTVGIVYGLAQESWSFFAHDMWEDADKALAADVDADQTTLDLGASGRTLASGDRIRLDDEVIKIVAVQGSTTTV